MGPTLIVTFVIKRAESSLGGTCRDVGRDPGEFGSGWAKEGWGYIGNVMSCFSKSGCLFPVKHKGQPKRKKCAKTASGEEVR